MIFKKSNILFIVLTLGCVNTFSQTNDALVKNISNYVCSCIDSKIQKSKQAIGLDKVFTKCLYKGFAKERYQLHKQNIFSNENEIQNAIMLELGMTCPEYVAMAALKESSGVKLEGGTKSDKTDQVGIFRNAYYDEGRFFFEFEDKKNKKSKFLVLEYFEGANEILMDLTGFLDREMKFEFEEKWIFDENEKIFKKYNMITRMHWQ